MGFHCGNCCAFFHRKLWNGRLLYYWFLNFIFIFYRGTYIINNLDLLGTRDLFFKLQDRLAPTITINIIGILVLIIFGVLLWRFLKRKGVDKK